MKFKITIESINEDFVVLKCISGQIIIPKQMFYEEPKIGDTWYISLNQNEFNDDTSKIDPKDVLNEILNSEP